MPSVATWSQNPGVVGVPTPCAQNVAICTCAAVRVSEIWRISASAAWNAGDPKAGGGADRNWLAEVRNQGSTPGNWPASDRRGGRVADPEPGAHRNGTGERSAEPVTLRARNDLGADRATDRFTARERGVQTPRAGVRLHSDHVVQRLDRKSTRLNSSH